MTSQLVGGVLAEKAPTLASAVAQFGRTAARKLTEVAVHGEPEDQLRAPLERLVSDLAEVSHRRREHLTWSGRHRSLT
jgi:hypothetical protein